MLEQKVEELKSEISVRKLNIRNISDSILNKFKKTNIDVLHYIKSEIQVPGLKNESQQQVAQRLLRPQETEEDWRWCQEWQLK